MRIITSTSAAARLEAAREFVLDALPASELLIVSASRGAADDFARALAKTRGATFGLYRFSLTQLAARLAAPLLSRARLLPTTALGVQAVAARALFDADHDKTLKYFAPVASTPGFPRALARTLEELALATVSVAALRVLPDGGADLADLFERFDAQFQSTSAVDRAAFLRTATEAAADAHGHDHPYAACRLVLLDVAITNATERGFVEALIARAPDTLATIPAGDFLTTDAFASFEPPVSLDRDEPTGLDRVRRHLFAATAPPPAEPLQEVELFSAPGEGRESVEIARRVLREARRGIPFDRMAIALRAPQHYAGLLEHALERAGVPAYFERGTRRPHPAGRAFLALLACALDNLSARRFAEYLSLGQVPEAPDAARAFPMSNDEVFGALGERAERQASEREEADEAAAAATPDTPVRRAFRAPWKWERLLAESKVVASEERWARRLNGLVARVRAAAPRARAHRARVAADRSARAERSTTSISWRLRAADHADAGGVARAGGVGRVARAFRAARAARAARPDRVLRVLADLRPMGAIGPVTLDEAVAGARRSAGERRSGAARPRAATAACSSPPRRSCAAAASTSCSSRRSPSGCSRRSRARIRCCWTMRVEQLDPALTTQPERAELEKLQLRLAVGAAEERLYVSFPTVEIGEGRPRVPSLYVLEVWRAMTGRVPSADELQQAAARSSRATLAWPAPADRDEAIDALEHDLATLRTASSTSPTIVRAAGRSTCCS